MTVLSAATRSQRSTLGDLAVMWIALFGAFAYLDVPFRNAPLFAVAVVLQAALGTLVITQLLDGLQPSLLLLCGPGLILGGALSFAVFQLTGRGAVGLGISLSCGVFACAGLVRKSVARDLGMQTGLLWLQLAGLAALAMSTEFEWLLIVAAGCLVSGVTWVVLATRRSMARIVVANGLLLAVVGATEFRGPFWWAVSDDYMLFDVITRHLAGSGPFASWGVVNFSRYHWMSYGWSGLLDFAASTPATLVTLTRVMPLVYSLALASSLLLVVERVLHPRKMSVLSVLPAWAIVASVRLDWAAPSTAGIFAVIAAAVAIATIIVDRNDALWRRWLLYAFFASVALLTKLPGSLVLVMVVTACELRRPRHGLQVASARMSPILTTTAAGTLQILALPLLGTAVGSFTVDWSGTAVEDSGPSSQVFSIARLFVINGWLISLLLVACLIWLRVEHTAEQGRARSLLFDLSPAFLVGTVANAVIPGTQKANFHEYFSVPNYFLVSLALLAISPHLSFHHRERHQCSAIGWSVFAIVLAIWNYAATRLAWPAALDRAVVRDTVGDPRLLFATAVLLAIWLRGRSVVRSIAIPLLLLIVLTIQQGVKPTTSHLVRDGRRPVIEPTELIAILGAEDAQVVGHWLRDNTRPRDIIATNYLRSPSSNAFIDDYSLAMWSRRTFLVIGPKFFYASDSAKSEIDVSLRFGAAPDAASTEDLATRGIGWFVVDRTVTRVSSWEPWAELRFESGRFAVLRMRQPAAP